MLNLTKHYKSIIITSTLLLMCVISYEQTSLANLDVEMVHVKGNTPMIMNHGGVGKNVTLDNFEISKYEVSQQLWQEVMGDNPSYYKDPRKPVESVDWYSCIVFCNELSSMTGRRPRYYKDRDFTQTIDKNDYVGKGTGKPFTSIEDSESDGYRLPLESEWQYAASGGEKSKGYTYSGSNNINEVAWNEGNNTVYGTKQVGLLKPNELGLYDMSGNVWEWCWDILGGQKFFYKECGDMDNGSGLYRLFRGGDWYGASSYCTTSYRFFNLLVTRFNIYGFRLASSVKKE